MFFYFSFIAKTTKNTNTPIQVYIGTFLVLRKIRVDKNVYF